MVSAAVRSVALLAVLAFVIGACSAESPLSGPSSATPIDLVTSNVDGRFPVAVRVIDRSGRLRSARAVTPAELTSELDRRPMEGAAIGAWPFEHSDHQLAIVWNGGACDRNASMVIAPEVARITLDAGTPEACSGPGTYRAVVIEFDGPIIADHVDLALD